MQLGDSVYKHRKQVPTRGERRNLTLNKRPRPLRRKPTRRYNLSDSPLANSLRMVALNEPWSGNMQGIHNINYQCQKEAMDAKVDGIFRAFLSTTGMHMKSLVRNRKDAIVNLYNKTLFQTWNDVFRLNHHFLRHNNELRNFLQSNASTVLFSFDGKNVILDDTW